MFAIYQLSMFDYLEEDTTFELYDVIMNNIMVVGDFVNHRYKKYKRPTDKMILDTYKYHRKHNSLKPCVAALCILIESDEGNLQHGVKNPNVFLEAEKILLNLGLIPNRELYKVPKYDYRKKMQFRKIKGMLVPREEKSVTRTGAMITAKYNATLSGSNISGDRMISSETINYLMDSLWSFMSSVKEGIQYIDYMKETGIDHYVNISFS